MSALLDDLRLALRNLRRRPGVPAIVVATLAIGIACTTAMFSVVHGVLLEPLPWPESDRLAVVWNRPPDVAAPIGLSKREVLDFQEMLDGVTIGTYDTADVPVTLGDREETFQVTFVTREVFEMLGAAPVLGRGFAPREYEYGAHPAVILSHETWQRLFGGSPDVLGEEVVVRGLARQVIGVMPPRFPLPLEIGSGGRTQLWIGSELGYADDWPRDVRMFPALARLGDGTTLAEARAELARATDELRRRHPEAYTPGWRIDLVPIEEEVLGAMRPGLLALFGAVFFVLMIACGNVAHLLLARADARRGEIAVRSALGAGRWRLARQLLLESVVLALAGGALGVALTFAAVAVVLARQPGDLPRFDGVGVDLPVLLFALGVSLLTPLLFGLLPLARAVGRDHLTALHRGRGAAGGLRLGGARRLLVAGEVALATVLLAGAGLLVATVYNLTRADLGFAPEGLVAASVSAPHGPDVEESDIIAFWDRLRTEAAARPGVEAAAISTSVPLHTGEMSRALEVAGGGPELHDLPRVTIERSSPAIARTMGVEVLRGRDLRESDDAGAPPVALVNATLARHLGDDVLGRRVRLAGGESEWLTVVGVVGDIIHEGVDAPPAPRIVVSYPQFPTSGLRTQSYMWLLLRARAGGDIAVADLRRLVREVAPSASLVRSVRMDDDVVAAELARYRFAASVLALFAGVAVALAVVGIYGLLSYLVRRGRREVGVRMAIGARPHDIYRLVSRQGLLLVTAGLAVGLPAAWALTGLLESLLYGVAPTDARTYAVTALLLLAAAMAASFLPAQRAMEVEPVEVLRNE